MIYSQVAVRFINDRPLQKSQNVGLWKQNYFHVIPTINAYRKSDTPKSLTFNDIQTVFKTKEERRINKRPRGIEQYLQKENFLARNFKKIEI